MKNILVPTDFTDVAFLASDIAMKLAPALHAKVHFYSRAHIPPNWEGPSEKMKLEFPEAYEQYEEVKANFRQLKERYADEKTLTEMSYSSGDLVDILAKYIDEEEIYMVLMGSSGADGMKELLFGSNTQKVVKQAHCPVLVVKHQPENLEFKNIVFASDFHPRALPAFEKVVDFGWHFGSHIHLLHVSPLDSWKEHDAGEEGDIALFEKACWKLPCTVHKFDDMNVELGITHFATDTQADLISIAHYGEENFLKGLFRGSITESLVNHLEIPIMVANTKKAKTWNSMVIEDSKTMT
ncbi:MAG: universal stress protein [Bacteroidota bacterium]